MFKFKPNLNGLSRMYKNLLEEPDLDSSGPTLLNEAGEAVRPPVVPRSVGFRLRKGIFLAFNIISLLLLATAFVFMAVADLYDHPESEHLRVCW